MQVLLLAGPGGCNFAEVMKRADSLGLTGDQPWGTVDANERKKLSSTLRQTATYFMYIGAATFAHTAYPGKFHSRATVVIFYG